MKKVKRKLVFTRNVNNHGMNRETVYQIVRIISQISLELHIKFWKCFNSIWSYAVEVAVHIKNKPLDYLAKVV